MYHEMDFDDLISGSVVFDFTSETIVTSQRIVIGAATALLPKSNANVVSPILIGQSVDYFESLSSRFFTDVGCHRPPRAVCIERAFNPSAIA